MRRRRRCWRKGRRSLEPLGFFPPPAAAAGAAGVRRTVTLDLRSVCAWNEHPTLPPAPLAPRRPAERAVTSEALFGWPQSEHRPTIVRLGARALVFFGKQEIG